MISNFRNLLYLSKISGTCFHLSKISGTCFHLSKITISLRFWTHPSHCHSHSNVYPVAEFWSDNQMVLHNIVFSACKFPFKTDDECVFHNISRKSHNQWHHFCFILTSIEANPDEMESTMTLVYDGNQLPIGKLYALCTSKPTFWRPISIYLRCFFLLLAAILLSKNIDQGVKS